MALHVLYSELLKNAPTRREQLARLVALAVREMYRSAICTCTQVVPYAAGTVSASPREDT